MSDATGRTDPIHLHEQRNGLLRRAAVHLDPTSIHRMTYALAGELTEDEIPITRLPRDRVEGVVSGGGCCLWTHDGLAIDGSRSAETSVSSALVMGAFDPNGDLEAEFVVGHPNAAAVGIAYDTAVELSPEVRYSVMSGDLQAIRLVAGEVAVDEVLGRDCSGGASGPPLHRKPDRAGIAQQTADLVVAADDPSSDTKLGRDASSDECAA